MSAVPKNSKPYGKECRALFHVPARWKMLGADASGLELRCLAHYMAKYDNGAYGKIILEGDVHAENRKALGSLVPQDDKGRDMAKTFIYAYLYGAGDEKIGSIVAPHETPERQKQIGAQLRKNFEGNTPALKYLVEAVKKIEDEGECGYLTMGYPRRAQNLRASRTRSTQLTAAKSAGAIICKRWIVTFAREMKKEFGPQGWRVNGPQCFGVTTKYKSPFVKRSQIAQERIAVATMQQMTEHFKLPLSAHW
jgi:DNA polymerase-1